MKKVEIVMPMRKPLAECTVEEYKKFMTWIETREVPETVMEALRITLQIENAERQATHASV